MSGKQTIEHAQRQSANSGCLRRLVRFFEVWSIFGPWNKLTWMTLFPPFRGWDIGCGYCRLERLALRKRHCERAKRTWYYAQCGVL